ncbi:hypothetical protein ACFCWG_24650 [Streptomyces sp. NPDC056390]|uniref:hypothetical protein n=1 Tax=Streptomyces sp. NPDC056390 TaxID=3345806 RepID=UPI0035E38C13
MTAIATEPAAALADLPSAPVTAEPVILPGLLTGLGVTKRPPIPAWITDRIPGLRDRGKHSPDVVIAKLREDIAKLLNWRAAADDFFAIQDQLITDLEGDARKLKRRAETDEQTIRQLEGVVRLRDQEIDDLKRKVDVGVKAEHVIAETQPIPVLPLGQAPFAATDPGHVPSLDATRGEAS